LSDFDALIGQVEGQEPFRLPVRLLLDSAAHAELQRLETQLERALNRPEDADITAVGPSGLATEIANLLEQHEPTEFVFTSVSALRWDELVAAHPSDSSDVSPAFWPAVMAECCVAPEGATLDGFTKLVGKINSGQRETLIQAVREVNRGLTDLRPSLAATALIRGTRRSSTTAALEGLPGPDSLAE